MILILIFNYSKWVTGNWQRAKVYDIDLYIHRVSKINLVYYN